MEFEHLDIFKKSASLLDNELFKEHNLQYKVGIWLNCVALKIQNPLWINQSETARPFQESIFFSVWINDTSADKWKLYYNIHALKLRQLTNYAIKSRDFAESFRLRFKAFEPQWPNVSINLGPLTLMEGWVKTDKQNIETDVAHLANQFLTIRYIIDDLLNERKKQKIN